MKSAERKIVIKNYIEEIILSKERRPKYYTYKQLDLLPKKYKEYLNKKLLYWDKNNLLCNLDGNRIISNPRVVGKPKTIRINGQKSYSGINFHLRSKIVLDMRKWFKNNIKNIEPFSKKDYPLKLEINFSKPYNEEKKLNFDLDNMKYFYQKTLQDSFVDLKIIEDDSVEYINEISASFNKIKGEDSFLEIKIYKNEK
jgi:Holliday junction resolvase RusA-like endonuclease